MEWPTGRTERGQGGHFAWFLVAETSLNAFGSKRFNCTVDRLTMTEVTDLVLTMMLEYCKLWLKVNTYLNWKGSILANRSCRHIKIDVGDWECFAIKYKTPSKRVQHWLICPRGTSKSTSLIGKGSLGKHRLDFFAKYATLSTCRSFVRPQQLPKPTDWKVVLQYCFP